MFILLPAFYLIIWLMTSPKKFEKIFILKILQLVFLWGIKIYFDKFLLKWCSFRHGKIWFSKIMPFNSYHFHLMQSLLYLDDILIIFWDPDVHKKTIFASINQYFNDKLSLFLTEVSFNTLEENQLIYFQNGYFFKIVWGCH